MERKKKYIILVFCVLVLAGAFFAIFEFGKTKKIMKVNVASLNEKDAQPEVVVENKTEEPILNNQSSVISDQENKINVDDEKNASDKQPAKTTDEQLIIKEQKENAVEDKTVEPEKPTETKVEIGKIVDKLISWGFTKSAERKIDTIILHSSYDALGSDPYSVSGIIAEYKQYEVSAHYLIARDGVIYRLVADQNIAWHAGVAKMPDGRTNVNSFSIGVEMINTKDGKYTDAQYGAVNSLIASLKKKYGIKNILGHNEVAPGRKTDPWGIQWSRVSR